MKSQTQSIVTGFHFTVSVYVCVLVCLGVGGVPQSGD